MTVTNLKIIKQRPLNYRYRDDSYHSEFTPFYLYGTSGQKHIDHMLLRAPNLQISADQVSLDLGNYKLSAADLGNGLIICATNARESTMQPLAKERAKIFFDSKRKFNVSIYKDPNGVDAKGPGLANVDPKNLLAKGAMVLAADIFVDDMVNQDPVVEPEIRPFCHRTKMAVLTPRHHSNKENICNDLGYSHYMKGE